MTVTRQQVRDAYQGGLNSGAWDSCPYATGILAALWRDGRKHLLDERAAGFEARIRAAARRREAEEASRTAAESRSSGSTT